MNTALHVDLNADLGEGAPDDAELLALVSSANIACGWHAGDARLMWATVAAALARGVAIGAHPSYPDRDNFGRSEMHLAPADVQADLIYQIGALDALVRAQGGRLHHVKPHGALYNQAARLCTACFTGKYPIELPGSDKLGKNLLERTDLGGLPAAGARSGAAAAAPGPAAATPGNPDTITVTEDPAEKPGATGCDPGPDSEFENLLTEADRVPDVHHDAAPVGADKKESV